MAEPSYRLSQFPTAQNKRHLPQGGKQHHPFGKGLYKPRFDTEQVSDIKDALSLFGDDRQSRHTAGDFLYLTAKQKGDLDSREQIKAKREVENAVEGCYDYQQERGFSMGR